MKNRLVKRGAALLAAAALFVAGRPQILAESAENAGNPQVWETSDRGDYAQYIEPYRETARPETSIVLEAGDNFRAGQGTDAQARPEFEGRESVLLWTGGGEVDWTFTVERAGLYHFRLTYFMTDDTADAAEFGLLLDGASPFRAAEGLRFRRLYTYEETMPADERGNQIRPAPKPVREWLCGQPDEPEGQLQYGYSFYLSAGVHTLRLEGVRTGVALDTLEFYNEAPLPDYETYGAGAVPAGEGKAQTVQGETPLYVNDPVLYPVYDRTSADTQPADPVKLMLNTIGGTNYSTPGQKIAWNVKAPADGWYRLAVRVRQNLSIGLTAYRRLRINGEVPFAQADAIPFHFDRKWQEIVLGGEDGAWLFHLRGGDNVIELEVVPGETAAISSQLQQLVRRLNALYRKIIMITGVTPDSNRDYQLEKQIPDLMQSLAELDKQVTAILKDARALGNGVTGDLSKLDELQVLLRSFQKEPALVATRVAKIQESYSSLSTLLLNLKNQPLEVDYILAAPGEEAPVFHKAGFFGGLWFGVQSFLGSFYEDYNAMGGTDGEERHVSVWINLGREQTSVLKSLASSRFTPQTGIRADVSLVQQSLVQAALSGRGPDVVLFVQQADPINLAMRGALQPLDGFDTFAQTVGRFHPQALNPYRYKGATYALPLQENFPMMFYRTDILEELGLEPPETWDDFYKMVRVLQHSNMTAGIPNMPSDSQMTTNNGMFAMFLYQMGGQYYRPDMTATDFLTEEAVGAFRVWTDLYRDYGLPYQYDFFNRFRNGEMPVALETYTQYNKLLTGAPEIRGLWKMAPVPGIRDENGVVHNQVCGNGTAALMMKRARDKQAAWAFIDWFTGADAQEAYGRELETLLGPSGRYDTANREAFAALPWTQEEQALIRTQWDALFELPQVPGGYYVDRSLTNAFRRVVFYGENPRDTLAKYSQDMNSEIQRKWKEFGHD